MTEWAKHAYPARTRFSVLGHQQGCFSVLWSLSLGSQWDTMPTRHCCRKCSWISSQQWAPHKLSSSLRPEAWSGWVVWLGVLHLRVANSCPDSTYSILAPVFQSFLPICTKWLAVVFCWASLTWKPSVPPASTFLVLIPSVAAVENKPLLCCLAIPWRSGCGQDCACLSMLFLTHLTASGTPSSAVAFLVIVCFFLDAKVTWT